MTFNQDQDYIISRKDEYWTIAFSAMASPCEILVKCEHESEAGQLASLAFYKTKHIEIKYSRYRDDNIIYDINNSKGKAVEIDEETANLLKFADQCFDLSDGLFDITSGILRRAWKFKGQAINPDKKLIKELLESVGGIKCSGTTPVSLFFPVWKSIWAESAKNTLLIKSLTCYFQSSDIRLW